MAANFQMALVGFGEAGAAFTKGWKAEGATGLRAYDIKTAAADTAEAKWHDYKAAGVAGCESVEVLLEDAGVIFSLVTADRAFEAAEAAAAHIAKGALFFDGNSCAPGTKRRSALVIEAAGGRYVDLAILAPVHPKLHKAPVMISGPHVAEAKEALDALHMDATLMEGEVGAASSVKMVRSIMMKGLEALFAECVLAGRKAGVDEKVLASLEVTYPGFGFETRAAYIFERMPRHGLRRAAEMREVVLTVEELGLSNAMAAATVGWQQRLGDLGIVLKEDDDYKGQADDILSLLDK